ncbi:hypothetical protein BCR35DRAFT_274133 [Leucosporidium creatinivorum]|uniref:1-phosphatidylinositol-3-phosphate 5-kinase n=1 Tax=Leucosporidium creatinivorum TaxID=106004 RepID=A0A1Y2G240_9BASI|nr:hypothetical protein BCR35DRAFT_274133 [Leucosporidium creatinivorum]
MAATSSGFESFPVLFNDSDGEETIGSKIKRFFLPTGPSQSSASSATGSATPSTTTATPAAASPAVKQAPAAPAPTSPVPIETPHHATKSRQHSRNNSATQQQLAQLAAVGPPSRPSQSTSTTPFPSSSDSAQPLPSYPTRPNGRKVVRPIRLSGVSPSVRVTVANSERGDLIQSASSRSIYGDSRYGSDVVGTPGGVHGSPNANNGFGAALANLSSIPGFPLGREGGDDTKSVRSMSTVARPSPSVAHVFRKLRGEGLSTDYWIKDESSKECFDCQMLFTAFRRKHHCRICGQIFCSRCASNIISSARFGQQGFVRVCNLCLSVLEHGGTSPEEPAAPRFRSNLRDSPLTISAPLEASARPPQSQFAASHLFPRSETPYNFPTSEAEFGRISETSSRGGTPFSEDDEASSPKQSLDFAPRPSTSPPVAVAPFRRELAEDDSAERAPDGLGIAAGETDDDHLDEEARLLEARLEGPPPSLASGGSGGDKAAPVILAPPPIEQVLSSSASILDKSPKAPISSSLPHLDTDSLPSAKPSPALPSSERALSRLSTYTSEPGGTSAFIFQDLPLDGADLERILAESGPYLGHADANPSREVLPLSPPALRHIRKMLQQAISREGLAHPKTWEKVLFKLLLRVGTEILPDLRAGDSIDVREYVRIKKVPGGHPRDSEYVDGVVFTKNLLHKQMDRHLPNPRVMLVSFPLEYQRVENQLMSLEPLLKQEKEYLHNLVHRIAAQRPHVVLAERNVSRLALEYLMDHNIAVARNVKREAIEAVARATQADIISSMDKLALEPRLGRCGTFRVQTFAHSLVPGGRKTFMRFEGCPESFGCTLLVRGGSMAVLAKVKKILEMMILVAYNAKLEEYFYRDEIVCPPPDAEDEQEQPSTAVADQQPPPLLANFAEQDRDRISKDIAQALRPYETTVLSGSALVRIPPPYTLSRMSEEDRRIVALRRLREYEETEQILQEEALSRQIISASSSSTSLRSISSERAPPSTAPSTAGTESYVKPPEDPLKVLQTPQDVARLTEFADAEERHTEQLVTWDAYLASNKDSLDPLDHQRIYFLDSLLCTQTARLCSPPTIRSIDFYGDNDESVGQWVERICRDAGKACPNANCGRHNLAHSRQIVHGDLRLTLVPEVHRVDLDRPELEGQIVLFAYCRKCQKRTGQMAMSDEMYRLSFGKYLELTFCGRLLRADGLCDHDAHTDHIRYWMHSGISMRIVPEHIDLRNVVAPPRVLKIRPEKQLILRNDEYRTVLQKSNAFWDSIVHRIQSFNYDLVQADRLEECRQAMAELSSKCESDRRAITRLLESTYEHAQATNGTEMTSVRRTLQNKAVDWEAEWTSFEQRIIPSEKDVRRLTTVQLKRLFSNDGMPLSPERRTTSSGLAPSIEADEKEGGECSGEKAECEDDGALSLASQSTYGSMTSISSCLDLQPPTPTLPTPAPTSPVGEPSTISSTDNESDSTVCADHPSLDTNTNTSLPSPYAVRRHRPRADDTSGADSELEVRAPPIRRGRSSHGGVAQLVNFFSENPESSNGEGKAPTGSSKSSVSRPSLKRGVTEGKLRPKSRVSSKDIFFDGEGNSYARNVGVSHLSSQSQQAFAERPSRIPARKAISKAGDLARVFDPPTEGERRRLPTSSQPTSPRASRPTSPRASFAFNLSTSPTTSRPASRSGSRSGRATPALSRGSSFEHSGITIKASRPSLSTASSSHSIRSSLKGKSKEIAGRGYESSETGRSTKSSGAKALGLSRPTASSMNKATRRVVSQSSGHRVSTIANHFNKLSRDNERERQRKLTLFRGKRARPVAIAHPTIQVFDNVKDAAKEDSDEDEGQSSDGADDEDDDEHEEDSEGDDDGKDSRSRSPDRRARVEPSTTSTKESFTYDATAPAISMADALARPTLQSVAPDEAAATVNAEDMPKVEISEADATSEADAPSVPPSPLLNEGFATLPRTSEGESSGNERGSIIKAISSLWAYRGGDFTPLEYPLAAGEHIFADNPILVREDEPSSILAFALSSKAYRSKVEEQSTAAPSRAVLDRSETFMPDELQPADRSSNWGVVDFAQEATDVEDTLRKPEAKHFRLQFEEGTTTFFCKIFFAEQFDALRRNCGCSSQFIESLARCVKWESSGGRSKVDFLKTKDDRFIVKEISRLEMDALLRFAPAYFEYMSKAIFHGLPTILAKIFGFYRIGLRNPTTGKVMRLDVLVMENLFYERQLTQVFDLKGSTRNRHVQVTKERPNEVLMDENLVEISLLSPLYVREESKRYLKAAIFNDSLFLSNLNVMDYSLVVGVDSVKQELVVGIVDFIRTYTWDKRLESWVKDTAFLGGGSSKPGGPTIITPKQYKHRFRQAMNDYFLLSPDAWVSPSSFIPVCTEPPKEEKETYAGATTEAAAS